MNTNRWLLGIAFVATLACVPAKAQYAYGYSNITADSYGNLSGCSATEEDDELYWEGFDAVVQGDIVGPSGEYASGAGFDDGTGYAEVDLSAVADVSGSYVEEGGHWIEIVLGEFYLGQSEAGVSVTVCGPLATAELTISAQFVSPPVRLSTLAPNGLFPGYPVSESDAGGSYDQCWNMYPNYNSDTGLSQSSAPLPFGWTTVDSATDYYTDTNGYYPPAIAFYRSVNVVPCGYVVYQNMAMSCLGVTPTQDSPGQVYTTNTIIDNLTTSTVTVCRTGTTCGTISY